MALSSLVISRNLPGTYLLSRQYLPV